MRQYATQKTQPSTQPSFSVGKVCPGTAYFRVQIRGRAGNGFTASYRLPYQIDQCFCQCRALNAGIDRLNRLPASPRPLGVSGQAALEPAPIGRLRAGAPAALSVKYLKNRHGVAPPCRTPCTVCGGALCDAFPCHAFLSIQLNDIPRGSLHAGLRPALRHRWHLPIQIPVRICRDKAQQRAAAAKRRRSPVAAAGREPASFGRFRPGSAGARANRAFAGRHPGSPYSTRVSGLPVGRSPFYAGWR